MKFRLLLTIAAFFSVVATGAAHGITDARTVREDGVSKLDKTFAIEANHGLMRDTALAMIALHRAESKEVRNFAASIHEQRNRAHARLRKLANTTRIRLPERLDTHHRMQVEKLSALKGRALDKQFLKYIAETDHTRFYEFELNSGANRVYPPVLRFAKDQLPKLRDDMARARKLLQKYA